MSSAFETLLEAARFIELQEQRERLTSTSSTASSLSTSPHSNSRYHYQSNYASHQSLVSTPPASPLSDIPRSHIDFMSNGSTITRNGKFDQIFCFLENSCFFIKKFDRHSVFWNLLKNITSFTKCFALCGLIGCASVQKKNDKVHLTSFNTHSSVDSI